MNFINEMGQRVSDAILHNQKTAVAVPVGTAALGTFSALAQIQSWLTVISMGLGIVISTVILRHNLIKIKIAKLEHETAVMKYEQAAKGEF